MPAAIRFSLVSVFLILFIHISLSEVAESLELLRETLETAITYLSNPEPFSARTWRS